MDTAIKSMDMKQSLLALIPEFELIRDTELREKTLQVWEDAVLEGGWTLEAIERMPFSVHVADCQITFIEHVRTVCKMCIAVSQVLKESYGERTRINADHLLSGALLADVGKLIEYSAQEGRIMLSERGRQLRHPFVGVALSHARGIPVEIQHIIATHSKEGEMMVRSNESVIFHHADFIDFDLVSKKRPF